MIKWKYLRERECEKEKDRVIGPTRTRTNSLNLSDLAATASEFSDSQVKRTDIIPTPVHLRPWNGIRLASVTKTKLHTDNLIARILSITTWYYFKTKFIPDYPWGIGCFLDSLARTVFDIGFSRILLIQWMKSNYEISTMN